MQQHGCTNHQHIEIIKESLSHQTTTLRNSDLFSLAAPNDKKWAPQKIVSMAFKSQRKWGSKDSTQARFLFPHKWVLNKHWRHENKMHIYLMSSSWLRMESKKKARVKKSNCSPPLSITGRRWNVIYSSIFGGQNK